MCSVSVRRWRALLPTRLAPPRRPRYISEMAMSWCQEMALHAAECNAVLALGPHRSYLLGALIIAYHSLNWGALGMQTPYVQGPSSGTCKVGKYDWRVPPHLRCCNLAADTGASACVISPFTGSSEAISIDPDTSCEHLTDVFFGSEPTWSSHIVPIWPALAAHVLAFTMEPLHPSLAAIVVVSPDWQTAFLVPRRADLVWLLRFLRSTSNYPIFKIRPPPCALIAGASDSDAIDWRTGDVIFAQPSEDLFNSLAPPTFTNGTHVRHRAFWAADFRVSCPLTILLWRPGWQPTKTTMPPDAYWSAAEHSFLGEFEQRYPGQWVPVPWAYDDRPHLCQRTGTLQTP